MNRHARYLMLAPTLLIAGCASSLNVKVHNETNEQMWMVKINQKSTGLCGSSTFIESREVISSEIASISSQVDLWKLVRINGIEYSIPQEFENICQHWSQRWWLSRAFEDDGHIFLLAGRNPVLIYKKRAWELTPRHDG